VALAGGSSSPSGNRDVAMNVPPPSLEDEAELPCPHCGYDLRGAVANRCSECGNTFNPEELRQSNFPWARVTRPFSPGAYLRTVWMVCIRPKKLRYEASKPQDLQRALWFRRITAGLVGLAMAGLFIVLVMTEAIRFSHQPIISPYDPYRGGSPTQPWYIALAYDCLVPLSAVMSVPIVLFVAPAVVLALGIDLVYVPGRLFRRNNSSPEQAKRAKAISCYATAPFALVVLAVIAVVLTFLLCSGVTNLLEDVVARFPLEIQWFAEQVGLGIAIVLIVLPLLGAMLGVVLIPTRALQWACRFHHFEFPDLLWMIARLVAGWIGSVLLCLVLVPSFLGFLWTVVDSLL
jgi:hypothetical protein